MAGTKGVTTRGAFLEKKDQSVKIHCQAENIPQFSLRNYRMVAPVKVLSCSFQVVCAMARSSCAPMDAASLRAISVMGATIVETSRMRGTAM